MRQVSQNKCDLRDQKLDALFPSTFVLVHDSVRASSRFIYGTVMAGVINRDPYSHSYLVPGRFRRCARFLLLLLKLPHKIVSVFEIIILKDNGKLVAADSENGTVLEHAANQAARALQILIALVVTVSVVYLFKVIAVKNANGKFKLLISIYPFLKRFYVVGKSTFVPHRGKRVNKNTFVQRTDQALLFKNLPLRLDVAK